MELAIKLKNPIMRDLLINRFAYNGTLMSSEEDIIRLALALLQYCANTLDESDRAVSARDILNLAENYKIFPEDCDYIRELKAFRQDSFFPTKNIQDLHASAYRVLSDRIVLKETVEKCPNLNHDKKDSGSSKDGYRKKMYNLLLNLKNSD